ncbi:MAG: Xaa-Pro peptidase family protein [Anaerolineae bacterium]|nr:Xaa-Pro peptidase family protein [Anaerolineae bacterium]
MSNTQLRISDAEHKQRCDRLLEYLQSENLAGVTLFDRDYILYYAGFAFIPTERPIGFIMSRSGERALFVPRLELEHAQANALTDRVAHYQEYPDRPHPMHVLADLLQEMGISGEIGGDGDGYPWILGYRGPLLSEIMDVHVHSARAFIEDQMAVKSEAELNCLRESCKWGNLAHMLLQEYTAVGASETEVSQRASNEATLAMYKAIGPIYRAQAGMMGSGASAGYRGQIGRNSAIPHALANNLRFQAGDVLVTGAGAPVWGYHSELERTTFMGKPSDKQRWFFDHMVGLQDTALNAMEPGKPCSEVDRAVRAYFEKHDLMPFWKHHSGHTIGLRYHEGPYLDLGDDTILQPGMVFTVEPGLYSPEFGGFRHSDTAAITEDGLEIMTFYPRDAESLTIPV